MSEHDYFKFGDFLEGFLYFMIFYAAKSHKIVHFD